MSDQTPPSPELSQALDAIRAGRFKLAAQHAAIARRKAPSDPRVLAALGQSLARSGSAKAALAPLRKAVNADKSNPFFRYELANALDETANTTEALAEIEAILEATPGFDHAIQLRCTILRRSGRAAEAWQWLSPMLATLPSTYPIALAAASLLPPGESPDPVLERIRAAIANEHTNPISRRSLFYALAKLLDRIGSYDLAFAAAESANRLFPPASLDQHQKLLDRMTPKLLESIEPASIDASLAVLVCGMPRSGTTLTEQIIAAHPSAATVGESSTLGRITKTVLTHANDHGVVPTELSTKLAKQYLKHLREDSRPNRPNVERVVDKMPQNLMFLGVVDRLLPGCHVVRCLRDPRDIAISCYMQDFNHAHPYRSTQESLADELILHEHTAARWKQQTNLSIYESVLEELTADPEARARSLVESVGLEFDDQCLRFHEQAGHVNTASVDQIRSGINTKGQGRWKNYESQLQPLIERIKQILPDSSHPSNEPRA